MATRLHFTVITRTIHDPETQTYSARMVEFPALIVFDETPELAYERLIETFELMVEKDLGYILDIVNNRYKTDFKIDNSRVKIVKSKTYVKNEPKEQEIELEMEPA